MKTSSWLTYFGPGRVGISRGMPHDAARGYLMYRALAPGPWFKSVDYPEYHRRYREQLAKLDPARVQDELHALVAPDEPVLLCFERAPLHADNWCHRAIVAQWLVETTGLVIEEIGHGKHQSPDWQKVPPATTGPITPKTVKRRPPPASRSRPLEPVT